jgi:hypothetical protein
MRSKKTLVLTVLLVMLTVGGSLQAWKEQALSSKMSFGIFLQQRLSYGYTDPAGISQEWDADSVQAVNRFFGMNFKYFMTPSLGFGIDMMLLDWASYTEQQVSTGSGYDQYGYYTYIQSTTAKVDISKWLIDLDLIYRMAITPKILLNGGIGLTYEVLYWTVDTGYSIEKGSESGDMVGFNLKLGGEYKLDEMFSISGDWKWQYWPTGVGDEKYSIFSFAVGLNISM